MLVRIGDFLLRNYPFFFLPNNPFFFSKNFFFLVTSIKIVSSFFSSFPDVKDVY